MDPKIFHIKADKELYILAAYNEAEAKQYFLKEEGYEQNDIESIQEIPETQWDTMTVHAYEDNNSENEPIDVTYRELISGSSIPEVLASTFFINDLD